MTTYTKVSQFLAPANQNSNIYIPVEQRNAPAGYNCNKDYNYYSESACSKSSEDDLDLLSITPAKLCMGGDYMYSGNSWRSKMCRELLQTNHTPYGCCKGYNGQRAQSFVYTPLSNSQWKNERCDCCPYDEQYVGYSEKHTLYTK